MLWIGNRKKGRLGGGVHFASQDSPSLALRVRQMQRLVVIGAFIILVAVITKIPSLGDPTGRYDIDSEDIPQQNFRTVFTFDAENLEETRVAREAAANEVPYYYRVASVTVADQMTSLSDTKIAALKTVERLQQVDVAIGNALLESTSAQSKKAVVENALVQLVEGWKKDDPLFTDYPEAPVLLPWLMPDLDTVPSRDFGDEGGKASSVESTEEEARPTIDLIKPEADAAAYSNFAPLATLAENGLRYILVRGIRQPDSLTMMEGADGVQAVILRGSSGISELEGREELPQDEILTPDTAREALRAYISGQALKLATESGATQIEWTQISTAAFEMAATGIVETLGLDSMVRDGEMESARKAVEPITRPILARQVIQREGAKWTAQTRNDVKAWWDEREKRQEGPRAVFLRPLLANCVFVALMLLALLRAMPLLLTPKVSPQRSTNLVLLIMCSTLILGRIVSTFELPGLIVPLTAGAILLTILTNARLAVLASALTAVLLSIQYTRDWQLLIVSISMAFAGISSLYLVRRRGDMAGAAAKATLVGLLTFLAITLASGESIDRVTFDSLAMVAMNGALCLFVVPGLLSPLERLFGITTDIQLLEYSDLNNEILSRVAIEVPATYAHSLMLGQLAEAAADAIGANGLLARVCAYYHDVGKLKRPEYFIENQTGHNIHDDLSPRLSARAICAHVTEGAEMAREFHLPQPIINGILEHHGTTLIGFFHQQALDQQKHGDVREEDYRYPGPKPQSRETAILMICDAVESGVRSIKNPNEERVREFIDKIVQARSADRQFDECDLTLKMLDVIGEVLTKRMLTALHTRISYPEKAAEGDTDNVIPMSGGRE